MILGFGFKNFFSFREGLNISFRLPPSSPAAISTGRDFSTVLGVKGANGAGKTHVLRALSFLGFFCTRSFESAPDADVQIEPFFGSTEPCEFYVDFRLQEGEFRYELVVSEKKVHRETLYLTRSRRTKIFERIDNEVISCIKKMSSLTTIKLRTNASIISIAHQYELSELKDIHKFFRWILTNVFFGGLREAGLEMSVVSKFLFEHKDVFEFVKNFIKSCDTGIDDIVIASRENDDGKKEYFPGFFHAVEGDRHGITHVTESSGTKALFRQLMLYKLVLDAGGVLALDEFDVYLHPHILPKLLDLFISPESNPKGAQVVFSTHQTDVLDLLGRHRTYIVNKSENESFGYRLDEIPGDILRNDRPISPAYNSGKIGGVPAL